jgi:hypothetical protein
MRFLTVFTFMMVTFLSGPSFALSCIEPNPEVIPQNELIVRAKILEIKTALHVPYLQDAEHQDDIITFEILDVYKGPQDLPEKITATFSRIMKTWGPKFTAGEEGEFLFDRAQSGEWQYAGPGGCTFVSEKAWEVLRAGAQQ